MVISNELATNGPRIIQDHRKNRFNLIILQKIYHIYINNLDCLRILNP